VLAMMDKPPAKRGLDAAAELPACASIARRRVWERTGWKRIDPLLPGRAP
jgi:hypothetical protein